MNARQILCIVSIIIAPYVPKIFVYALIVKIQIHQKYAILKKLGQDGMYSIMNVDYQGVRWNNIGNVFIYLLPIYVE